MITTKLYKCGSSPEDAGEACKQLAEDWFGIQVKDLDAILYPRYRPAKGEAPGSIYVADSQMCKDDQLLSTKPMSLDWSKTQAMQKLKKWVRLIPVLG